MTIDEMKQRKTELGLTSQMIADQSGVPLGTVQKIFSGATKAPRKLTLDALAKVLGPSFSEIIPKSSTLEGNASPGVVREGPFVYGTSPQNQLNTVSDYYSLPDNRRVELIDGVFYDMVAPSYLHQLILGGLFRLFADCIEKHNMPCEVFMAPCDVRLDQNDYTMLQPDLLVICGRKDYLQLKYLEGAPDLAVEILSPSTRSKDMILKLYKYKNAGVREYWIVDLQNQSVTVHDFRDEESYDPQKYCKRQILGWIPFWA